MHLECASTQSTPSTLSATINEALGAVVLIRACNSLYKWRPETFVPNCHHHLLSLSPLPSLLSLFLFCLLSLSFSLSSVPSSSSPPFFSSPLFFSFCLWRGSTNQVGIVRLECVFFAVFSHCVVYLYCVFLCIRGRCFQYCACDVSTVVLLFWTIVFACCALVRRYGAFCVLCFSQSFVLDSAFVSDSAFVCVSVIRSQQWLVVHFKNLTHRLTMNGSSGLTRVVSRSSEHGKNDMSECFYRGRSCNVLS